MNLTLRTIIRGMLFLCWRLHYTPNIKLTIKSLTEIVLSIYRVTPYTF